MNSPTHVAVLFLITTMTLHCMVSIAGPAAAPIAVPEKPAVARPVFGLIDLRGSSAAASSDAWITRDLKSTFRHTGLVDGSRIAVTTHNGVVDLSGRAANATERALAIELARNVRGARTVTAVNLE